MGASWPEVCLMDHAWSWSSLELTPQESNVRAKLLPRFPVKAMLVRDVFSWVQRTQPCHFPRPLNLELVCPAYVPPYTASKFFARFCYFEICQNGLKGACLALWPWEVLRAWGVTSRLALWDGKCPALGESVPWEEPEADLCPHGQNPLLQGHSPFRCPCLPCLLLLDPSRIDSLVSEVVWGFYWKIQAWVFPTTEVIFFTSLFTND